VCVCVYTCVCACVDVCVYVCVRVHVRVCKCVPSLLVANLFAASVPWLSVFVLCLCFVCALFVLCVCMYGCVCV